MSVNTAKVIFQSHEFIFHIHKVICHNIHFFPLSSVHQTEILISRSFPLPLLQKQVRRKEKTGTGIQMPFTIYFSLPEMLQKCFWIYGGNTFVGAQRLILRLITANAYNAHQHMKRQDQSRAVGILNPKALNHRDLRHGIQLIQETKVRSSS